MARALEMLGVFSLTFCFVWILLGFIWSAYGSDREDWES